MFEDNANCELASVMFEQLQYSDAETWPVGKEHRKTVTLRSLAEALSGLSDSLQLCS